MPRNKQPGLPASLSSMPIKTSRLPVGLRPAAPARLLAAALLLAGAALADDTGKGYRLGRGYSLGDTGIGLGGYASAHAQGFGGTPWSINLNSLSAFVTWDNGGKLRFFSETEAENALTADYGQGLTTGNANLHSERLYLDYLATDSLTVRAGKFLTPVGQWNLIHVDPLVWTTSRPVATTNLFSDYAAGIMLQGTIPIGSRFLEYAAYGDYSSVLDPSRVEGPNFDNAQGMRWRYHLDDSLQIGFSYLDFTLSGGAYTRNHLAGLDFAWSQQRFAVNSEIVYRKTDAEANLNPSPAPLQGGGPPAIAQPAWRNAWQGYLQGVGPLSESLYLVGRYEFFDRAGGQTGQAEVLGLAYRPQPPLVWKLEYRLGQHNRGLAPDGLLASFSVLF